MVEEENNTRSGCRRGLQRLALAGVGLLFGLVAAEALCKVLDNRTARQRLEVTQRISRVSDIPGVRYELIPGVTDITPGSRQEVRVNAWGFRGPDVGERKPPGTFRIAVLGDSIAFGRTYHEAEIFPTLLQEGLATALPDRRFEVLNASLAGRDTWEEAAILEHRVLPLEPDLVILQICLNDHVRLAPPDPDSDVGVFGEEPWYSYSSLLRMLDRTIPGFQAHHVAWTERLGLQPTGNRFLMNQMVAPVQMLDVTAHWEDWSGELLRIRDLTEGAGAKLLLVVFPIDWQMKKGWTSSQPDLAGLAEREGLPLLDMIAFYGSDVERYLRDYTHPSRTGHRVAAREIQRVIAAYLERSPVPP